MSQVLRIEMADDVLVGLQKEPKQLAAEMRIAAAVKWYEMGAEPGQGRGGSRLEPGGLHRRTQPLRRIALSGERGGNPGVRQGTQPTTQGGSRFAGLPWAIIMSSLRDSRRSGQSWKNDSYVPHRIFSAVVTPLSSPTVSTFWH